MASGSAINGQRQTDFQAEQGHFLQLHDGDRILVPEIARVLCIALDQGLGALSIARPSAAAAITLNLHDRGVDVKAVQQEKRYVVLDAATTLTSITRRGWPDEQLFTEILGGIIDPMCIAFQRVAIFGEMVGLLWEGKKFDEAVRLERLWNEFMKAQPVSLYCAYPHQAATDPAYADAFLQICNEHCRLLHAGSPLTQLAATPVPHGQSPTVPNP